VTARLALRVIEWLIALVGYVIYLRMRAEVREIQHEAEDDEAKGEGDESGRGPPTPGRADLVLGVRSATHPSAMSD
jgi:hypothetical protein